LWPRILEVAAAIGHINVNGWGENFAHPEFLAFLRALDELGVRTNFSTNGSYLTEDRVRSLADLRHLVHVNVSVDSPDPAVFLQVRGRPLAPVLRGLQLLAQGFDPAKLTVSSVVTQGTAQSLLGMPALLASIGIRNYWLQGLVEGHSEGEERAVDRQWEAIIGAVVEECRARGIEVLAVPRLAQQITGREASIWGASDSQLRLSGPSQAPATRQCNAPWEAVFVNKDGLVFPCCSCAAWEHRTPGGDGIMGDLRQASFSEIWNGKRFRRFREDLLQGHLPAICRDCELVSTGPHFYRLFAATIECLSIQEGEVELTLQNRGERDWEAAAPLGIATTRPRMHDSLLVHESWQSGRVVALLPLETGGRVRPGELARVRFALAPIPDRTETFQAFIPDICWLPGTSFTVATGPDGSADHVGRESMP
jgi:radical SAM protein with 4Fe4S-binding SPASM domain